MLTIRKADIGDSLFISRGFHIAMLYKNVSEELIASFASCICVREDVLYSWKNTIIAEWDGEVVGMLTSYDGKFYHDMRIRTMDLLYHYFEEGYPGMEDEASEGEYYLDSLAVLPQFRGRGIGRALLQKGIEMGHSLGLDVTLAVDPPNLRAKKLYQSLGFKQEGTLFIFGHNYEKMVNRQVL